MRRIPFGPTFRRMALSLAAFTLPVTAFAAPPEDEEEDELVLDDEDEMEEAATPAPTDSGGGALDGGGGLDFLDGGEDGGEDGGDAGGETAPGAELDTAEQEALDEKLIVISSRQSFLNVFRKEGRADGKLVRRFELSPQVGFSLNDPFVRHISAGAEFDYWLTNRMAIGITGNAFFGSKTANYDRIRFQEGILLTANRYLWEASAVFSYEPFYGKIAIFNRVLWHWEAYVQLGGGAIMSQVLPRFESIHDPFSTVTGQGNFAMGARMYFPGLQFMSVNLGVRNWIFVDKLEPQNRGPDTDVGAEGEIIDDPALDDPSLAKAAADNSLSFNTMFFVGVGFHLPPTFEYSTRR